MKNIFRQSVIFAFFLGFLLTWLCFGAKGAINVSLLSPNTFEAAEVFKENCAKCHGKDGRAKTFRGKILGAQNFTEAAWQAGTSDEHIFNVISNGRKKMPSFSKKLSESDINSLVTYIRTLKE